MTQICFVNAGSGLADADAAAVLPAHQLWDDSMLRPAWSLDPCTYLFLPWERFADAPPPRAAVEPIFLNNHSSDPTIGGFHDFADGASYARVFVGDCLRDGLSWTVDLSHEAGEMRVNPGLRRCERLASGDIALVEACDPVEDERYGIMVRGHLMSDFVLPSYFDDAPGPWDYGGHLAGPCPALTWGGYQSLFRVGASEWSSVTEMRLGEGPSARALRYATGRFSRRARLPGPGIPPSLPPPAPAPPAGLFRRIIDGLRL